jgi:uroporphyrinogen decarboxylase
MVSRPQPVPRPAELADASGGTPPGPPPQGRQRFLDACQCRPVERPPVWLMRQAGRALPEYRRLKERYSFLELVQTPELAAEVTLQPIRRFGFDAAILFSDILVVPEAMGQPYHFREAGGVQMAFALRDAADVERLEPEAVVERLQYVARTLRLLKAELNGQAALIGFCGSPWTLANFMMEGGSAREFTKAKALCLGDPKVFGQLLEKLTRAVIACLKMQIEAGADAVQIFGSLEGLLADNLVAAAATRWVQQIVAALDGRVPVILFAKGAHGSLPALVDTGAQVLGFDWTVRLAEVARALPPRVAVQGNLDPCLLTTSPAIVRRETRRLLEDMRRRPGHIVNLGHGVPPAAKLDCIESLVTTVKGFTGGGNGATGRPDDGGQHADPT